MLGFPIHYSEGLGLLGFQLLGSYYKVAVGVSIRISVRVAAHGPESGGHRVSGLSLMRMQRAALPGLWFPNWGPKKKNQTLKKPE